MVGQFPTISRNYSKGGVYRFVSFMIIRGEMVEKCNRGSLKEKEGILINAWLNGEVSIDKREKIRVKQFYPYEYRYYYDAI